MTRRAKWIRSVICAAGLLALVLWQLLLFRMPWPQTHRWHAASVLGEHDKFVYLLHAVVVGRP